MNNPVYGTISGELGKREAIAIKCRVDQRYEGRVRVTHADDQASVILGGISLEDVSEVEGIISDVLDDLDCDAVLSYKLQDDYGLTCGVLSRNGTMEAEDEDADEKIGKLKEAEERALSAARAADAPKA